MADINYKRVTLLAGHYGSGKTNIAVNLALEIKKHYPVVIREAYREPKDTEKLVQMKAWGCELI